MLKLYWYPIQLLIEKKLFFVPWTPVFVYQSIFFSKILLRFCKRIEIFNDVIELELAHRHLLIVTFFLKRHWVCQYNQLVDIAVQDKLLSHHRFFLHYNFLSVYYNQRIRIKVIATELSVLHSLKALFASSVWVEREIWDLFGLVFNRNPDLRRILTDYGFQGFPLRKDFPLTGFYEIFFSESDYSIKKISVSLTQELRLFDNT
jgi:NADH dehydrogenase (ubiquinone) Fe-S protein 3